MANILLGFPNRIDSASLSGGSWVASLPLNNLKDRVLSRVARSASLSPAASTFVIDLGTSRSIRILALIAHNISLSGRLHIEASTTADFATHVLDVRVDAWGSIVNAAWDINSLEWENDNYWLGGYTQEEIEGQTPISSHIFPQNVVARYWRITVSDTGNPAGFVDIGRCFIGDGFLSPGINYDYGGSLGYEDATGIDTSLSGAEFFDIREPVRVMRFQLSRLTDDEGFAKALELTRRAGVHREIFVVADADDNTFAAQRNFIGRLRSLSPLEQAMLQYNTMSFEIKELR